MRALVAAVVVAVGAVGSACAPPAASRQVVPVPGQCAPTFDEYVASSRLEQAVESIGSQYVYDVFYVPYAKLFDCSKRAVGFEDIDIRVRSTSPDPSSIALDMVMTATWTVVLADSTRVSRRLEVPFWEDRTIDGVLRFQTVRFRLACDDEYTPQPRALLPGGGWLFSHVGGWEQQGNLGGYDPARPCVDVEVTTL